MKKKCDAVEEQGFIFKTQAILSSTPASELVGLISKKN